MPKLAMNNLEILPFRYSLVPSVELRLKICSVCEENRSAKNVLYTFFNEIFIFLTTTCKSQFSIEFQSVAMLSIYCSPNFLSSSFLALLRLPSKVTKGKTWTTRVKFRKLSNNSYYLEQQRHKTKRNGKMQSGNVPGKCNDRHSCQCIGVLDPKWETTTLRFRH